MIPLSVPNLAGNELAYVKECIDTGWISSAGSFVDRFEKEFASFIDQPSALSLMNGTAALHIALKMIGVEKGDLVIMPNVTFVASANAISYTGAEPVLIDIDKHTWQMDLDLLEQFLQEDCERDSNNTLVLKETKQRIAALMIIHVQGNICDMDRLQKICSLYQLPLLEDAAEALGSKYKGAFAGTFGDFGCFSFNGNKIMSTGGGGMLVAKNENELAHARHLSTTAKTDSLTYFHDEVGFNYRLVNVLAALGVAQLEQLNGFIAQKRHIADVYRSELKVVGDIGFQQVSEEVESNEWLFTITTDRMQDLLEHLNANGVMSRPFWVPMNQLPMYTACKYVELSDVSASVHASAISIPCSTGISDAELAVVCAEIRKFYGE